MSLDAELWRRIDAEVDRRCESDTPGRKAAFAQAVRQNIRNWEELRHEDSEVFRLEVGISWCARIMVTSDQNSPQYAQARSEDLKLRDRRYEAWERLAAAKDQVKSQANLNLTSNIGGQ